MKPTGFTSAVFFFFFFVFVFASFWVVDASSPRSAVEDELVSVSQSDGDSESIDWNSLPAETVLSVLYQADDLSEAALLSDTFTIPHTDDFAKLPFRFLSKGDIYLFTLFLEKFDYSRVNLIHLWGIVLTSIAINNSSYFKTVLECQTDLIVANFRTFWYHLMSVDVIVTVNDAEIETIDRSRCKNIHPAIAVAFEYFAKLPVSPNATPEQNLAKLASFCIFDLLFEDPRSPFPKSFLKAIFKIPGIDFNASREGNCVAIYTLGRLRLPDYYYRLILCDPRLDVNCVIPSSRRKHGHITCLIPSMPLFWHALIYQNYRAMGHLWANGNLHVMPLVPSFFLLLRLTILFIFYYLWDGKNFQGERRII